MSKLGLTVLAAAAITGCGRTDIGDFSPGLAGSGGGSTGAGGRATAGAGGAAGKACGPLIDDMESDRGHICQGDGRQGVWYAFNDGTGPGSQWPPLTTPGTPIAMSPSTRPGSRYAVHTYGFGFTYWAGIGADFDYDGVTYRSYDARQYDGVTFWAKSDVSTAINVRLSTPTTTESRYGGHCPTEPCPQPLFVRVALTPTWTQYQVAFNDFDSASLDSPALELHDLLNIQFTPNGATYPFDYWLDELAFYTAPRDCCGSFPPACQGVLTFADPNLTAAVRDATGASGDVRCEDLCNHLRIGAENRNIQSLAGMECLTLLTGVDFDHNPIVDMTPLAALPNLRGVALDDTQISRLPSLQGMTHLDSLGFDDTPVVDIGPTLSAPALKVLSIVNTKLDCTAQAPNIAKLRTYATVFSDCP